MEDVTLRVKKKNSLIKGRISEGLVKELFLGLGMDVYPYGIECQMPHVAKLYKEGKFKNSVALQHVANQPDFIVCANHNDENNLYRVEVKFRSSGSIGVNELLPYDDDVIFILLDQKTFYILERNELLKKYGKKDVILFGQLTRLSQESVFSLEKWQKKFVYEFSGYVAQYLCLSQPDKEIEIPNAKIEKKPFLKNVLRRVLSA